jgi:hypothetical protein
VKCLWWVKCPVGEVRYRPLYTNNTFYEKY